jgi:hypothetical protein
MLPAGIEPATLALLAPRSNQLSYESLFSRLEKIHINFKIMSRDI